jgi:hypothetical protein
MGVNAYHERTTVMATLTDPHLSLARPVTPRTPGGCDSSPLRHARAHAFAVGHPIVQSFEPGEDWRWCYVDETFV